jgi:5-(carboxyamino)imidazole ribonucleotide mutase
MDFDGLLLAADSGRVVLSLRHSCGFVGFSLKPSCQFIHDRDDEQSLLNCRDFLPRSRPFEERSRGLLIEEGKPRSSLPSILHLVEDNMRHAELLHATDAQVGVIMGSQSDWETMKESCRVLDEFGIVYEARVVSAHRTPKWMVEYAEKAAGRGLQVLIAGAGGAAHLPGMVASCTSLPVLGVPVQSKALNGLDSLLSIVQMPGGVPVATLAIGAAGAKNAALLAVRILALHNDGLRTRLAQYIESQTEKVLEAAVLEEKDFRS